VAGTYAAVALVWIVASDQLLTDAGVWAQTLTGAGFVAVTSAVLFAVVLAEERRRAAAARAVERTEREAAHAEDDERRRISDEIHDDPLQLVIALGMQLDLLRRRVDDPALRDTLDILVRQAQEAIEQLRDVMAELYPHGLERGALSGALADLLSRAGGPDERLECRLVDATSEPVPGDVCSVLYRSAREAILDAVRDARALHLEVRLDSSGGGTRVRVTDDGVGFATRGGSTAGHLGQVSMRARVERVGGRVSVDPEPGGGTTVVLWVPHAVAGEAIRSDPR
jgi:signal transduction histidine kinase